MSWSVNFAKPVLKQEAEAALDALPFPYKPEQGVREAAMCDQFAMAKQAAKFILSNTPGPFIYISMTGHANGCGYQKDESWSPDFVNVSVNQRHSVE